MIGLKMSETFLSVVEDFIPKHKSGGMNLSKLAVNQSGVSAGTEPMPPHNSSSLNNWTTKNLYIRTTKTDQV